MLSTGYSSQNVSKPTLKMKAATGIANAASPIPKLLKQVETALPIVKVFKTPENPSVIKILWVSHSGLHKA